MRQKISCDNKKYCVLNIAITRGMGQRERWEWGSGWGIHVHPWLIHNNVWQKPLKYCKAIILILHASKVMLKILQSRLQQYVNHELPDVQAVFRKERGTRDQIANICWIIKKQESSRKTSISALLTMPKPSTVWITIHCGKF